MTKNLKIQNKFQLRIKKKWKKSGIKISKELRDLINGYLMADGYARDGILTVDQGVHQKKFVEWLYEKFKLIRTDTPIRAVTRTHSKSQKTSGSFRFNTRALLHGFEKMWYQPYVNEKGVTIVKKQLPKSICCILNENVLAVWYACDGTKIIGSLGAKFEVTAWTVKERLQLKRIFLSKFGISTQIISSGTSASGNLQWALKIPASEYPTFHKLITKIDLIPTLFPYKLHKL
jgi:hypothetical protein